MSRILAATAISLIGWTTSAAEPASPPPVLSVRLIRPEAQGAAIIDLFRGSRAPHPAAALAAWKRATVDLSLGKPVEALVSVFNPPMAREWRILDGAEFELRLDSRTGAIRWNATVPKDDGSLAALTTAIALTDGAGDAAMEGRSVFRLGPPGAPFAANSPGMLIIASDRDGLQKGLGRLDRDRSLPEEKSGCFFRLEPEGLAGLNGLNASRCREALEGLGCRHAWGRLGFEGETLRLDFNAAPGGPAWATSPSAVEADWLGPIPRSGALAAVAVAIDSRPEAIAAVFSLLDRVEKADSTRAGVAPLRTRLNLLAAGVKVFPDQDLWPVLKGCTGVVLADDRGEISGGLLILHARDQAGAEVIFDRVLPRLASVLDKTGGKQADVDGVRSLGRMEGLPVFATLRGKSVVIASGRDALAAGLGAWNDPDRSAASHLKSSWGATSVQRIGAFWPGRWRRFAPVDSALAKSLADGPPLIWLGRNSGDAFHDLVEWRDLSGVVKRWLDALPLETPPDH